MTDQEFPEYAVKETKLAVASRGRLSPAQLKEVDEIVWQLADNPHRFEYSSTKTPTGQLLHRSPTSSVEVVYRVDAEKKIVFFFHFSAPLPPRHTIFISYSHEDEKWLRLLRKFLSWLEADGVIKLWDDSKIQPGERWEESISTALDSACAAVLLVSQDFLVSKFITTYELPRLLSAAAQQGKKIFWIPLRPSTVFESHKEITVFQSLTDDPDVTLAQLSKTKREKLLVKLSERLRGALQDA